MYYYFDDIIKFENFDFGNFLLDEKLYKNILIHDVSYKTFIGIKLLYIMFDKVNRFIRNYDGNKYLVLFGLENDEVIYRITLFIRLKSGIAHVFSYNFGKIKIDSDDDFPLEKTLTLYIIIIFIKSKFGMLTLII